MCCIGYKRANVEDYCDAYFTVKKYLACYEPALHPFPHNEIEEDDIPAHEKVLPPIIKWKLGRPRVARKKQEGETPAGGIIKRSSVVKCKIYKEFGHNKRTCTRAPPTDVSENWFTFFYYLVI